MTIPAQGGTLSYARQPDKIGKDGVFNAASLDFFKVRAPRISLGTIQDQQTLPLMVGGSLTPNGAFKQAHFFGGEVDLLPTLETSFGLLLKAALGAASSLTDTEADGTSTPDVNTHIFHFDPTSAFKQPWMAVRRIVPGVTASENFGETGFDCKVGTVSITIPAMGKIACRVQMIGRDTVIEHNPSWSYENADYENPQTIPDSGRGQFLIGGVEYPLIGASIDITNGLTTPQQEMVIGDFPPDDIVALTRNAQIRVVYKYENADLYSKLLTGEADGTEWSSLPFLQDTDGSGFAFEATFQAAINIGATSVPYSFRVRANRVTWAAPQPIELQAGGIVTQTFIGTVLEPATGLDYIQCVLENDIASY